MLRNRLLSSLFSLQSSPSKMKLSTASSFSVFPVPCLSDNYAYILQISSSSGSGITTTFVIDPVEPTKILPQLSTEPFAILTTHHHSDHAGGNAEMMKLVPGIQVFGGDERIASMSGVSNKLKLVHHGDVVWTNDDSSLDITALHTPCHTSGHICYYVYDKISKRGCVFTGDTLFVGGCGRFFEGTGQQMYHALIEVLGKLPADTEVYCGHEYTESNLKFAASLDPTNSTLVEKLKWASQQTCTVPSTIGEELATNPFMRVHDANIQKNCIDSSTSIITSDPIQVMDRLREMKNKFKG